MSASPNVPMRTSAAAPTAARMLVMVTIALLALALSLTTDLAGAQSRTLRCDGRLISVGDLDVQLRQTCGDPYFIDAWRHIVATPVHPGSAVATEVRFEEWYFDQGSNRFLQRVRLREGRVVRIDSLPSYGRSKPLRWCRGAPVRTGITIGELVALCGLPAQRRELGEALVVGQSPAESALPTRRERWLYPLHDERWLIAELAQGRIATLDTTPPR